MITRLSGILIAADSSAATIASASGDLAYEVLLPAYLTEFLLSPERPSPVGARLTLHTLHYLDSLNQGSSFIPRLVGFGSARERDFFELLTTVKGLGNRRALRALAIEPGMVARAIVERDNRVLQRLPEIGPKLAEAIIHELKTKAEDFVGLRAHIEFAAAQHAALPPSSMLEIKEVISPGAESSSSAPAAAPDSASTPNSATKPGTATTPGTPAPKRAASTQPPSSTPRTTKPKAAADSPARENPQPASPPPAPPIRETVQALIALGEQPLDAERMVARAIDRARSRGPESLDSIRSTAALLSAAYQAR